MSALMASLAQQALERGVPWSAHLDITYRCNERCVHCYLNHDDRGEMALSEIRDILSQLAGAGTFFLTISGGEPFVRKDIFEILEAARSLTFNLKLKTNGTMIGAEQAQRLRALGVETVQISVYSADPQVHDGITKLPGSLARTVKAIKFLRAQRLKVTLANVLMRENLYDYAGVAAMARELGAHFTIDPTITPHLEADAAPLTHRVPTHALREIFRRPELVGNVDEFCAPAHSATEDERQSFPCSAGHTSVYISPYAEVFPCVQFPLPLGNLRKQSFAQIWEHSPALEEVRSIRVRELHTCSGCDHVAGCTRCPGLAYIEGDMRGPSSADCEKSFARTGIWSANMRRKFSAALVQIAPAPAEATA